MQTVLRLLVYWFLCIWCTKTAAQNYSGDSWSSILKRGKGTLQVLYYTQPGLMHINQNGKPEGICPEILEDFKQFVASSYKIDLTINYLAEQKEFDNFLKTIKASPNILGVGNVTITKERQAYFDFTPPFLSNPIIMITHKEAPSVNSYEEFKRLLSGYRAVIIKGSTHELYALSLKNRYMQGLTIQYQHSGSAVLNNVAKDKKLFTIMDLTEFVYAVRKQLPVKRQTIHVASEEEHLGFILKKGTDWTRVWNEFMTETYRKSTHFKKHVVKHLGTAFLDVSQ